MRDAGYTISEAMRYLLIGLYFFVLMYLFGHRDVFYSLNNIGIEPALAIPLGSLLIGCAIYHVYKILIYVHLLSRIQDQLHDTYRTLLKDEYQLCHPQSIAFWRYIRWRHVKNPDNTEKGPDAKNKSSLSIETESSAVHFLYMAGIMTLAFSVISVFFKVDGVDKTTAGLIVGTILILSAFFYDGHLEYIEMLLYRRIRKDIRLYAREVDIEEKQRDNQGDAA